MNQLDASRLGANRVTIVAFDGIVADTIPRRATALATALADAITAEGASLQIDVRMHDILPPLRAWLPGRTFSEAVAVAMEQLPALQHDGIREDVTVRDLIALRAQRAWSEMASHGIPLRDGVQSWLQSALGRGLRMVLRSDSHRREVEPVLRLAGLEDSMLFLRCADDLPRVPRVSTLQASYEAIDVRLDRQRLPRTQRDVVEADDGAAAIALGFAATSRTML